MTDSEQHPYVEWIASEARRPVVMDPGARDRIMAAVRAEPVPAPTPAWRRLLQPRVFHMSPAGSALLAAGLVGIGVLTGVATSNNRGGRAAEHPRDVAVLPSQPPVSPPDTLYKFVIVAPQAESLIGEGVIALEMGATLEDIGLSIHPHPTLTEGIMDAAEAAHGKAIHIVNAKKAAPQPVEAR